MSAEGVLHLGGIAVASGIVYLNLDKVEAIAESLKEHIKKSRKSIEDEIYRIAGQMVDCRDPDNPKILKEFDTPVGRFLLYVSEAECPPLTVWQKIINFFVGLRYAPGLMYMQTPIHQILIWFLTFFSFAAFGGLIYLELKNSVAIAEHLPSSDLIFETDNTIWEIYFLFIATAIMVIIHAAIARKLDRLVPTCRRLAKEIAQRKAAPKFKAARIKISDDYAKAMAFLQEQHFAADQAAVDQAAVEQAAVEQAAVEKAVATEEPTRIETPQAPAGNRKKRVRRAKSPPVNGTPPADEA